MVKEGQLVFYATSSTDKLLSAGCIFTVDFIVPENAEPGDLYPFGLAYVNDGIATDTFINSAKDDAGKLQMTYVFTKGIYNGYIRMNGEKNLPQLLLRRQNPRSMLSLMNLKMVTISATMTA